MEPSTTDTQCRVLIVEPNVSEQKDLAERLSMSGITTDVVILPVVSEFRHLLSNSEFELVFLGAGLGITVQRTILASHTASPNTAIIAISKDGTQETARLLLDAGANAVLPFPFNDPLLEDAVRAGLAAINRAVPDTNALYEQISSLPWILQSVSTRMDAVARRIEDGRRQNNVTTPGSRKLLQEALLGVVATNDNALGELSAKLIKLLQAESNPAPKRATTFH